MKKRIMKKATVLISILTVSLFTGCAFDKMANNGGIPTEEQVNVAQEQLGDKAESMKFFLNGDVYQYPMDVQVMLDTGWIIDKSILSEVKTIPSYTTTTPISLEKKGDSEYASAKCYMTVTNDTGVDMEIGEVTIDTLEISKENGATLILPKGLTWDSTFQDVVEAYQPMEDHVINEADYISVIISNLENNINMNIIFDAESKTISNIKFY